MADDTPLAGKVALVAGATRGAGRAIAVELARAGAYVYATGRSSRVAGPSELDRPETIEETGGRPWWRWSRKRPIPGFALGAVRRQALCPGGW